MNFFKSVFSEDPTPPDSPTSPDPNPDPAISETAWSFGGLLKTLATKSESVIENYRKDIEELGSGLRNETSVIREAASRAVKGLPSSLEAGASVAQDSLESVGQAIDDLGSTVWRSTAQIILGKGNLDSDNSESTKLGDFDVRYSRFDAQVRGMQGDLDTYCSKPADESDYEDWRSRFWVVDEERKAEIGRLFGENEVIREVYNEVVPSKVDNETFWRRYFYRLDRLKKVEEARALIVKRAMHSGEGEEENLSWDFEEEEGAGVTRGDSVVEENDVAKVEEEEVDGSNGKSEDEKGAVVEGKGSGNGCESCKDSDISVVSSQSMLAEADDLGWDEIEYSGSNDEEGKGGEAVERTSLSGNSSRVDLRKRLSAAEEDLSWDIEDESDENVKS